MSDIFQAEQLKKKAKGLEFPIEILEVFYFRQNTQLDKATLHGAPG